MDFHEIWHNGYAIKDHLLQTLMSLFATLYNTNVTDVQSREVEWW